MAIQVVLNGNVGNINVARVVLATVPLPYNATTMIDGLESHPHNNVDALMKAIENAIGVHGAINFFYTREQI